MGVSIPGLVVKAKYYKKGQDRYVVVLWWKGVQYRRTYYDATTSLVHELLARQIADGINADIAQKGQNFDPRTWFRSSGKELQFRTYATKWLDDHEDGYAPSCVSDVRRDVRLFIQFFGDQDIRTIRNGQVEDFLKTLTGSFALSTQRRIMRRLHKLFADAYRREDIARIPGFPTVSVPHKSILKISTHWQEKIYDAIPDHDKPIFLLMMRLGVRPAEARALDWRDIDWDHKTITVRRTYSGSELRPRTKTGAEKEIPLLHDIEAVLRPHRAVAGHVFLSKAGKPYSKHLYKIWNKAVVDADAPRINLYNGTKHSLGCRLVDEGYSLEAVGKLFGHQDERSTRHYAEASVEAVRAMLETIPQPSQTTEKLNNIK